MAHCVNRNTKEFKSLLEETGANPVSLGADIALWQEKNGLDNFPTKSDLVASEMLMKKPMPVKVKEDLASKLTAKDIYGKRYIQKISGTNNQFRVLKDWKQKGLDIIKKLESEYPGAITYKTVNNEVIITTSPQTSLKFKSKTGFGEVESRDTLTPILDKLKSKFGLGYEFVNEPDSDWAGEYDGDIVKINLSKATLDTPFHEFAHPFIRVVRNTNRPLYNSLVKEMNTSKEGKIILAEVKKNYPELSDVDQIEEAIITAIGLYAQKSLKNTSLVARITDLLKDILKKLGLTSVNPKDLPNMTLAELGALMSSDVNIDISQAKGMLAPGEVSKSKKAAKQIESPFEQQFVFFKRRISTLEKQLAVEKKGSEKALKLEARILALSTKLEKAYKTQDENTFTELGLSALAEAEDYINKVEAVPSKANKDNLLYAVNILQSFYEFDNLATESRKLFKRAFPLILSHNLKTINQFATEGFEITEDMINAQVRDIGNFKASVGALADLANYIGRTIGSLIKAAQNRASTANKLYKNEVQKHVDALTKYGKENGKTLEQVYDMFIVETKDDLRLIQSEIYVDGEPVPNAEFNKIKSSKALLDFYVFYQESLKNADSNLPYKVGKHHIPNIHKSDIKYDLTHVIAKHNVIFDQFKSNEELYADMVPQQYRHKIAADKKSRDLGASILDFVAYSNNYNELSNTLPEVRLLQEQLKWTKMNDGTIKRREFLKSSDPSVKIFAEQTNLWKMTNTIIDMQLKGKMSEKQGEIKGKKIYDAEGNEIGYEAMYWSDVADLGLKFNSLLKIGFSPITAVTNVLFGDISNIIEAIGGRYFGMKDLAIATNIFHANVFNKESLLFKYLERVNPLQELDDYNLSDKVKLKKMSPEKLQEYMYGLQKQGELFLQSRTMLALMLKEGYIDNSGKLTAKGEELMKDDAKVAQLSDKVQRLNQLIHGRYSSREAAAMQQSVFYRLAIQFRKWIPSAIESRLGEKQYDNRLGMEIEGRYLTLARLVASKDVFTNLMKMAKGELSELEMYNMKKNLTELTLIAASLLGYLALASGSDEDRKRKRKNPYVKTLMTMLSRISGDLTFFYSPSQISNLASNAIPLSKTAGDLIKVVEYLPAAFYFGEYEYKSGGLKGRNKFWANLTKVTPGARPVQEVWKLINKNPLEF